MRVALYLRTSTETQDCDNQRLELEAFCARQNWSIVRGFVDFGFSGKDHERPAFRDMMQAASKRQFDCLLFWDLSRYRSRVNFGSAPNPDAIRRVLAQLSRGLH